MCGGGVLHGKSVRYRQVHATRSLFDYITLVVAFDFNPIDAWEEACGYRSRVDKLDDFAKVFFLGG